MKSRYGILFVTLFVTTVAQAADPHITKDEFDQLIARPFKAINVKNGNVVEIHLKPDNSAVAAQGYNDIGTWRRDGDAGYCVRWNKQRFDDRCSYFVKRDGKLAIVPPNGELAWWVEPLQK